MSDFVRRGRRTTTTTGDFGSAETRFLRGGSVSRRSGSGGMTAEQPRRDAHRECPVSSCCAPWTGQCLVAVRGWSSPASRPRNGGVECPIRNAKTRKDSREEGSRGAREPGNAPRGQGLDAELHGGAWYRGPVASVRSAARTAGRATGSGPSTTTFSVSCLMTASPRFRDAAGDGGDE